MTGNRKDYFEFNFEQALYDVDWNAIAVEFVKLNIDHPHLNRLSDDYFDILVNDYIIKRLYLILKIIFDY